MRFKSNMCADEEILRVLKMKCFSKAEIAIEFRLNEKPRDSAHV